MGKIVYLLKKVPTQETTHLQNNLLPAFKEMH